MRFELGYGKGTRVVEVPDQNLQAVLGAAGETGPIDERLELRRALENPIGTSRLGAILKPGEKIVIITSDITRPMPTHRVLPVLLDELAAAGVRDEDILVVFALGSHRPHTEAEQRALVSDAIFERIRCIDSDPEDCVHLGYTPAGTAVDIFRPVAEADRIICLGNIEYHYFAGYSGGIKAVMPGVSNRAAIQSNHAMMVRDAAKAGSMTGNPVREDIESVAAFIKVDFILNVVLGEHKEILKAVAGHPVEAHRVGCAFLDTLYRAPITAPADIVVVSPGGHPKDINLYQAQKALDNAAHAVRDGGIIILAGACPDGLGESTFARWMDEAHTPDDLIRRVGVHFELGGHKAAAIAAVLKRCRVFLVSDLPGDTVRGCFLEPYGDVQAALEDALAAMGAQARVIVMPYGGSTLPTCEG